MSNTIYTKKCTKCNEIKSFDEFYKSNSGKHGVIAVCILCRRRYANNRYIDNRDIILKKQKQYCINNKEHKKQYDKQYCINNKEHIQAKKKKYYYNNIEKSKLQRKRYRNSPALHETYAHQLTVDEEPILSSDGVSLEVRCKYCNKYFKPTNLQVSHRISAIKGNGSGDSSLYCHKSCKQSCGTYRKQSYPQGFKPTTSREVQPALRKLVLERDNWTCQKCYSTTDLHCHHIEAVSYNPIESADVDNCITLCKTCHKDTHKQDGCKYNELKCR